MQRPATRSKRRLDEVCLDQYPEFSRNVVQSWIAQGKVIVNDKVVLKAGTPVVADADVRITAMVPKYVSRCGEPPFQLCGPVGASSSLHAILLQRRLHICMWSITGWRRTSTRASALMSQRLSCRAGLSLGQLLSIEIRIQPRRKKKPCIRCIACRAGLKLEAALEHFGVDVTSKVALDAGLSTGGFTDCLLQRGAARVYGVDVGYAQVRTLISCPNGAERILPSW